MVGPTRQMSQGNMMPPHQPQPHMHLHRGMHAPQQIISIAGHQAMHAHLPHSGPPRQPLIIGANAQNPNGKFSSF